MATGKDTKYSVCSLCLNDGRNSVARHYCVDCEAYFCRRCVKCHTLPSLQSHEVNDVNINSDSTDVDSDTSLQSDVPGGSAHRLRCTIHQDKFIDTFCKDDDEVCCGSCAVVKHRSCTTISIADASRDFKSSPDMNKFKEALTENLVQCQHMKEKRTGNLDCIGKEKLQLVDDVDKYEEKGITKIKELANTTRNEILSKYEEHKTELDADIGALDVVIVTHTEYLDKLKHTDDEQLFVLLKTSKSVTKDGEMLLQAMTKDRKDRSIHFCFDQTFEKNILDMKSFGRLEDPNCVVTKYQATLQSKFNINDTNVSVVDICFMDPNNLLLTNCENKKLNRYNSHLQFKDAIVLSGEPVAVCKTNKQEVAVRVQSTKVVHFVSVGESMQITSSFTLDGDGWGMTSDVVAGEVFACEEQQVSVYSKTGNKLKTFGKDANGEQMFTKCRQIALSENRQDIYVTDETNGLIVLDKSGILKRKVSLSDFIRSWGLCLLPGDICLVGKFSSGVIVQIDKDGKQVGNMVDTKDGRQYTYCALYDREHSRLIVGGYPSAVSVYTLLANYT